MITRLLSGLFSLIAYVSTATVITLVVGLAYLWHTDRLNSEKMFRMVALFHDVDLHQLAEAQRKATDEVPAEEPSLDQMLRHQQVLDRNFEVKLLSLHQGRQEYDHRLQLLKDLIDRYDRMAQDWQNRLRQQQELTTQENLAKVVGQLEALKSPQAKEELMRWLADGRMDDAILLMSKMQEKKLVSLLKTFQTPEELTKLYEIHQRIIDSGKQSSSLDKALSDLNGLGASN